MILIKGFLVDNSSYENKMSPKFSWAHHLKSIEYSFSTVSVHNRLNWKCVLLTILIIELLTKEIGIDFVSQSDSSFSQHESEAVDIEVHAISESGTKLKMYDFLCYNAPRLPIFMWGGHCTFVKLRSLLYVFYLNQLRIKFLICLHIIKVYLKRD